MARNFRELRAKMSPERQAKNAARAAAIIAQMPLSELRSAHEMTQTRLAEIMEIEQSEVSRIERRTDMYLSTLRSYIEAMGGRLIIQAEFPNGSVEISQFHQVEG